MSSGDYTMGEFWKDVKEARKERRALHGTDCPGCRKKEPKRTPTILLPQQRCKVCGYRDPRPRLDV
jgi:hypothetical protein